MRIRRALPFTTASVLIAAACAGSDSDPAATDTIATPSTETDPPTTEPVADDTADTEPPATEPPTAEPPATDPVDSAAPATDAPADTVANTSPRTEPPAAAYDFSAVGPIVDEFVAERGLDGAGLVVVERDAGVVHEQYWGDFDADRISLVASSSKMITAGVLLHLDDEGVLDIDTPVAEVVDWGSANPAITPAQLISNSSGLVGLFPDPVFAPYICQYIADGTLQDCAASIFTTPDDDAQVISPDTEFRYGGAQWTVAGAVAEAASGQSFTELVDEIFTQPCGLTSLGFNNHFAQIGSGFDYPVEFDGDPSTLADTDNPNPEGGAYIAAPDYAQLLLMHLRDGMCGDTQVLSADALDTMHSDRIGPTYGGEAGAVDTAGGGTGYGMGWWVDRETGRISDGGAYGSVPWLDLDDGYGAYLVIEADSGTGNELAGLLEEVIHTAVTT